jgi:uncharacterized protein YycO
MFWTRRVLIRLLLPITRLLGHVRIAPKNRDVKRRDVERLIAELRLGDIILTYSEGELTNLLIEGEYKHCAIYAGSERVIEAIGQGVVVTDIDDFCATKDKIAVCRANFCTDKELISAVRYARDRRGSPYDYFFEPNEKAFYCAELISRSFDYAKAGMSPFYRRDVWGIETVLPIDFKLATKKFTTELEIP